MKTVNSLIDACVADFRQDYLCTNDDATECPACMDGSHFAAGNQNYRMTDENEFGDAVVTYSDGWYAAAVRWNLFLNEVDVFDFNHAVSEILRGECADAAEATA